MFKVKDILKRLEKINPDANITFVLNTRVYPVNKIETTPSESDVFLKIK